MTTQEKNQGMDFEIATSNRRLVARLIDLAIGFFGFMFIAGIGPALLDLWLDLDVNAVGTAFMVSWLLLLVMYDTVMLRIWGKTIGKMAMGLRVVDINGEKLGWGYCLLRAVILYLCGLGIGFLTAVTASIFGWIFMAGLGKYKRFPQDSVTHSFVVRETKGVLVRTTPASPGIASSLTINPPRPSPLSDLDRLFEQGMISKEEWERKKMEMEGK